MRSDERSDVLRCFTKATRGSPCIEKIVKYIKILSYILPSYHTSIFAQTELNTNVAAVSFRPISQSELDFRWPGMSPQRFRLHGTFSPALSSWPQMFSLAFGRGHEMMAFG